MGLVTVSQAAKRLKTSTQEIESLQSSGMLVPTTTRPSKRFPDQMVRVYAPADLDLLRSRVKTHLKYIKVCPNRRFGVELEGFGIDHNTIDSGLCAAFEGGSQRMGGWWVCEDGSIEGDYSFEVKSPPIAGEAGLVDVSTVCKMLTGMGGEVNSSCGLHIHHEARDITDDRRRRVFHLYGRSEKQLDRLMPWGRRENRNGFCRTMVSPSYGSYWERGDRGYKLNLFSHERHGTVEFRHHSGTLNPKKVNNWIVLTQKILQRAFSDEPLVQDGKSYTWSQMLSVLGLSDATESGEEWASDITVFLAGRREEMDKRAKKEDDKRKLRQLEAERRTRQHRQELAQAAREARASDAERFIEAPSPPMFDIDLSPASVPTTARGWADGCNCPECHDAVALFLSEEYGEAYNDVRQDDFPTLLAQAEERIRRNERRG